MILLKLLTCNISINSFVSHTVPQCKIVLGNQWTPRAERQAEKERAAAGEELSTNGGRTELMYLFPILPKFPYKY